jgi:hypothetical protein
MNRHAGGKIRGIALIEALITLLVLSIGFISVARFQSDLVASSGYTKARSEALQVAAAKLEELRNVATQAQYDDLPAEWMEDVVNGTNSAFTRRWRAPLAASGPGRRSIEVEVQWTDPKQGAQLVGLTSAIAWNDLAVGGGGARDLNQQAGAVSSPRGGARRGGDNDYSESGIPEDAVWDEETDTYNYVIDGKRELIRADGKVLMTVDDGQEFSTIAGKIYVQVNSSGNIYLKPNNYSGSDYEYVLEKLFVIPPVECLRVTYDPLDKLPVEAIGSAVKYRYFAYKCFVGPDWSGNIGIEKIDGAGNKDRVCLGDPTVEYVDVSTSRHPALSTYRLYRGYEQVEGVYRSSGRGIGMQGGSYIAQHYTEHNFLLTELNVNPNATPEQERDLCKTKMEAISPSPMARQDGQGDTTHPGRFFCLSAACPDELPSGEPPVTVIAGTITRRDDTGNRAVVVGLSITGGECNITSTSNTTYGYSCQIDWRGSIGTIWEGYITVETDEGHVLCSSGAEGPGVIDTETSTIYFEGMSAADAQVNQDFAVKHPNGSCP